MRRIVLVLYFLFVCVSFCSADTYDYLAKKISKGAKNLTNKKVAILPFQYYDGRTSPGSTIVAEYLTTKIVEQGKLQVVERTLLNKIMDEMKLGKSGIIDQETTKEIGKILGVEAIVTGVLIEEGEAEEGLRKEEKVNINTRLIKVETGDILVAASKTVNKTWEDIPAAETEEPTAPEKIPISKPEEPTQPSQPEVIRIGPSEKIAEEPTLLIPQELRQSYRSLTENQYRNAIDIAKDVFHRNQNKPFIASHALFIIGRAHESQGEFRQARIAYLKIIKDYPYNRIVVQKAQFRLKQLERQR
ncbi:MAG: CsgG/HfaB family protein [Elusimicrobiota bacterium]